MTRHHTMQQRAGRLLRAVALPVSTLALATLLTGCQLPLTTATSSDGAWANTCPSAGRKVAALVEVDASGSTPYTRVEGAFAQALRDRAARVAMCGGELRVAAFAGSDAGTIPLFDGPVPVQGSTTIAKARRVPAAVDTVVAAVSKRFPLHTATLAPGSDIVGQFTSAEQFAAQLGSSYVLDFVVVTDGLDNQTVSTNDITDMPSAKKLGQIVAVPSLAGAWVTVVGLGEDAGQPVDTDDAAALTVFYAELCRRSSATRCDVAVDYTSPVGG